MTEEQAGVENDRNRNKKRALVLIVGLLAASGVGSLAFAYWTGGGSGGGSATTASGTTAVSFLQSGSPSGLAPGGSVTVAGTVRNTNTSDVQLTTVTPSVSFASGANLQADATKPACTTGDFTVGSVTTSTLLIPAGTNSVTWSVTLSMKNTAANQDNCKNVSPNVDITAS